MLLKKQYKELLKYKDSDVANTSNLSYVVRRLLEEKLIQTVNIHKITVKESVQVERIFPFLRITDKGKDALEEYEAQQEQKRMEHWLSIAAIIISVLTLVATVLFGIIGLLR